MEYSKGDSRYVAKDTATVTVEGIMAVLEGPASLLAVYAIASRKSYSHILQFAVCLGQLYGWLVYFIIAYLDEFNFWVSPFNFWAFHWPKQFIGCHTNTDRHKELEEDLCSDSSKRKGSSKGSSQVWLEHKHTFNDILAKLSASTRFEKKIHLQFTLFLAQPICILPSLFMHLMITKLENGTTGVLITVEPSDLESEDFPEHLFPDPLGEIFSHGTEVVMLSNIEQEREHRKNNEGWMPPYTTALKLPISACLHSGALSMTNLLKDGGGSFGSSILSALPSDPSDLDLLAIENLLLMSWLLDCPTMEVVPAPRSSPTSFESRVC